MKQQEKEGEKQFLITIETNKKKAVIKGTLS